MGDGHVTNDDPKLLAAVWESDPDISHPLAEVDSSSIARIGYDEVRERLYVVFKKSGLLYTYTGVPHTEYARFLEDPVNGSHGVHFNTVIRPTYECEHSTVNWK